MAKPFKPMKGEPIEDPSILKYPGFISPKLDGIRAVVYGGILCSASMKPIRNRYIQQRFRGLPEGTDGELILGDPTSRGVFRRTTSAVMRTGGEPDVKFHVFDRYIPHMGYLDRLLELGDALAHPHVVEVKQHLVMSAEIFDLYYQGFLRDGYEGIVYRSIKGLYKPGRSTLREGYMLKLKPFKDSEAVVLSVYPLMRNDNTAFENETGHTSRSSAMDGLVATDCVGGFDVRDIHTGVEFSVGSGLDRLPNAIHDSGPELWKIRDLLPGRIIKYRYFAIGDYDAPRHPTYEGFRDPIDITVGV
jgi:DNA ligase-1